MKHKLLQGIDTFAAWKLPLLMFVVFILATVFFQIFLFQNTTSSSTNATLPTPAMYVCWSLFYGLMGLLFGFVFVIHTPTYKFIGYGALVCAVVTLAVQFAAYANMVTGAQLSLLMLLVYILLVFVCWEVTYDKAIARLPNYLVGLAFSWIVFVTVLYCIAAGLFINTNITTDTNAGSVTTTTIHGNLSVTGILFTNTLLPQSTSTSSSSNTLSPSSSNNHRDPISEYPISDGIGVSESNSNTTHKDTLLSSSALRMQQIQQRSSSSSSSTIGSSALMFQESFFDSMTDGTLSITHGTIQDATNIQAQTLSDDIAVLNRGSLTNVQFLKASVITDGSATLDQGNLSEIRHMTVIGEIITIAKINLSPSHTYSFTGAEYFEESGSFDADWNQQICINGIPMPGIMIVANMLSNPVPGDFFIVKNNSTSESGISFEITVQWPSGGYRRNILTGAQHGQQLIAASPGTQPVIEMGVSSYQNYISFAQNTIFTNNFVTLYQRDLTSLGLLESQVLTDGAMSLSNGELTSASLISASTFTDGYNTTISDGSISAPTLTDGTSTMNAGTLTARQVDIGYGGGLIFPSSEIVNIQFGSFNSTNYTTFPLSPSSETSQEIILGSTIDLPFFKTNVYFDLTNVGQGNSIQQQPFGTLLNLMTFESDNLFKVNMTSQNLNTYVVDSGGGYLVKWMAFAFG